MNNIKKEFLIKFAVLLLIFVSLYLVMRSRGEEATPLERVDVILSELEIRTKLFGPNHPEDNIESELKDLEKEIK